MRLMVIDGNSIINRAFYGIRTLTNRQGLNTNAVYGFLNIYLKLLDDLAPDGVCVCFDLRAPTFRHLEYDGYKSSRKGMPDELAEQLPILKDVLDKMGVCRLELEGYEADDLIGTVSRRAEAAGWDTVIVTGDRDSLQLITDRVTVSLVTSSAGRTDTVIYDSGKVFEKYGIPVSAMIDLKGLMGDKSDDIPGVAGIGEKTALDLVQRFDSIDNIYANLDALDIRDSVRQKLKNGEEMARLSRRLAEIDCSVPVEFDADCARGRERDAEGLFELFNRLEFNRLIERMKLYPAQNAPPPPPAFVPPPAEIVDTPGELAELRGSLAGTDLVAVAIAPELRAVAVCRGGRCAVVPRPVLEPQVFDEFVRYLFCDEINKSVCDLKSILHELEIEKINCGGVSFDVGLAAYVLSPTESGYDLPAVAQRYISAELPPDSSLSGPFAFSLMDTGGAVDALSARAAAIFELTGKLRDELEKSSGTALFDGIELPLCTVLAEMESCGCLVDRASLTALGSELSGEIAGLEQSIYAEAGSQFNINSTKQLGEILFTALGLPVVKKTRTGVSTDIEVLEKLRGEHPIIDSLIQYRSLTKLKSTYVDGLSKMIGPGGRIRTSFNMTATATGRLSSTEPNLQNIPIRQERGASIRRMFVAPEGWKLIDADYSQIELRVLAHIAQDEVMLEAFRTGADVHTITASQVFGVEAERVTPLMRRHAKAVNFGIVYGISDFSLAQDIGVTRADARRYMDAYFAKYAGVRAYMTEIIERAKADGFVSTLLGRRRYLPELHAKNHNVRAFGERVALNTPIQGTAADIIKIAMLRVRSALLDSGLRARLILQVHDELIVESPESELDRAMEIVVREMERAYPDILLKADAGSGDNWFDAKG